MKPSHFDWRVHQQASVADNRLLSLTATNRSRWAGAFDYICAFGAFESIFMELYNK